MLLQYQVVIWCVYLQPLFFASPETTFATVAVIDILIITQDPNSDSHRYIIHVKREALCQKLFDRKVKKHKQ